MWNKIERTPANGYRLFYSEKQSTGGTPKSINSEWNKLTKAEKMAYSRRVAEMKEKEVRSRSPSITALANWVDWLKHTRQFKVVADGQNEGQDQRVDAKVLGETPVVDIIIRNVVCSFSVRSRLDLQRIAENGFNVEYRKESGMAVMKLRNPAITACIRSTGNLTCTGATSEVMAKLGARRVARCISKLGYPEIRFANYRIVNILATCTMPFAVELLPFTDKHRDVASYEPELHPAASYCIKEPKTTLKIFSTGSITATGPSVGNIQAAIEHIYPLVLEFGKKRTAENIRAMAATKRQKTRRHCPLDSFYDEDGVSGIDLSDDDDKDF